MIKPGTIFLIVLFSCLCLNLYSFTAQGLIDAIKKTDISHLELELKRNKVSAEEAKDLLEIAKEVEAKKKFRLLKPPTEKKRLLKVYNKRKLVLAGGVALGTGICAWLDANDAFGNIGQDKEITKLSTLIFGFTSLISGSYAINLYRKINRSEDKRERYSLSVPYVNGLK